MVPHVGYFPVASTPQPRGVKPAQQTISFSQNEHEFANMNMSSQK
jgi:hypothetical protein